MYGVLTLTKQGGGNTIKDRTLKKTENSKKRKNEKEKENGFPEKK